MTKTPLQRKFSESGHSLDYCARLLKERATGNRKRDARELETAKRRFQSALRSGGCTEGYARRVAVLLGVQETRLHDLLLKPRTSWPQWALDGSGELLREAKAGQGETIHEPKRANAARPSRKHLDVGRIVILEVL